MKIVQASTNEQEEKIRDLIDYIYNWIFPQYFSKKEIEGFRQLKILAAHKDLDGTLKEAYQIISSLQTLIYLVESGKLEHKVYTEMFQNNVEILSRLGIDFPFLTAQFIEKRGQKYDGAYYIESTANSLFN